MARLPFLVEHGPIVWQGLAAIAAAVAIAVVRRARARWEQRATARELAARAAQTTAPVEGRATVRGTLRGGRAASVSLLHLRGPRPYYDERAPELWLDCDGQRVALDGAIRVVRGTRVVTTRDRRSAVPDDELAVRSSPILHRMPAMAVSVRDGDDVFVTARLAPRPGAEVRGYREATTVWTASPDAGELELVAAAPVIRAIPLGRTRSAATGAAAAGLAIAALWAAGGVAMWRARSTAPSTDHLAAARVTGLEPLALAAATPGHRGEALAALEARFDTHLERTPEAFALWRRVARLRRGCGGEIEARIAQGEIEGLAELAQRCDDDRAAGDAYQLLGLFREAAERDAELPAGEQHIESLIAIGAWQRAGWWAGTQRDRAVRSPAPFACAEQWFRWLAGVIPATTARARFPHGVPACSVIAALLLPDARRSAALAAAAADPEVQPMADALAWADGTPRDAAAIIPTGRVALHRAALPLSALASERTRFAPEPGVVTDPDIPWQRYQAMYWGALPDRQACDRLEPDPAGGFKAVVQRAARSGDGRELAGLLARCRLRGAPVIEAVIEAVFAVWPRLGAGRDRLAGVLRTIDLGPPATDPLAVIGRAAMRRDLARLTGDAGRAAAWQAVVVRHLQAFSSYTALTALMVRELLRAADSGER